MIRIFLILLLFPSICIAGGFDDMDITELEAQLIDHEGYSRKPYMSAGKLHIGIGRNLEYNGLSMDEALYLLRYDLAEAVIDLEKIFAGFSNFSKNRRYALIDMRLNLGPNGFRKFNRMIRAIKMGDWNLAAVESVDSSWCEIVAKRCSEDIYSMLRDE